MNGSVQLPIFDQEKLYTPSQLAHMLGVAVKTLWSWRRGKTGPPAYRIGPRLYYRDSDVRVWLEGNKETPDILLSLGSGLSPLSPER